MAEKGVVRRVGSLWGRRQTQKPAPSAYAGEIRPRVWPRLVPHGGDWNWGRKRIQVGKTEEAVETIRVLVWVLWL
jgi:hypothetical protein